MIALIAAPSVPVLTLAELKTMLGIAGTASDDMLEALIPAVAGLLDPAAGGWLGRALRPQTWELRLSGFQSESIRLPYPPVTEVSSIKYDDADGVEQTAVEGTDYRIVGLGDFRKTTVEPIYGGSWPSVRSDTEAVRIRYVAGYAGSAMPAAVKAAVALGVQQLRSTGERNLYLAGEEIPGVRSRRWVVSPAAAAAVERAIGNLLAGYRVYA